MDHLLSRERKLCFLVWFLMSWDIQEDIENWIVEKNCENDKRD